MKIKQAVLGTMVMGVCAGVFAGKATHTFIPNSDFLALYSTSYVTAPNTVVNINKKPRYMLQQGTQQTYALYQCVTTTCTNEPEPRLTPWKVYNIYWSTADYEYKLKKNDTDTIKLWCGQNHCTNTLDTAINDKFKGIWLSGVYSQGDYVIHVIE